MELREKILNTSKAMFCEYGLKRVSIDDICNELRISKKTFYSIFKQKEELIESTLREMHAQKKREQSIDIKDNVIESLMKNSYIFKQRAEEKPFHLMHDLSKYYPQIFQKYTEYMKKESLEEISDFLKRGIEQGVVRKEINMNLFPLFLSESMSHFFTSIRNEKKIKWAVIIDFFLDSMVHLTANEKGLKYYYERKK